MNAIGRRLLHFDTDIFVVVYSVLSKITIFDNNLQLPFHVVMQLTKNILKLGSIHKGAKVGKKDSLIFEWPFRLKIQHFF